MSAYIRAYIKAIEAFGWEGGLEFKTTITPMENGGERRNASWRYPKPSYSLPFRNILKSRYDFIREMHLNRRGRWGAFLYFDYQDRDADGDVFAIGDGVTKVFQLSKTSVVDGYEFERAATALYVPSPNMDGTAMESEIDIFVNSAIELGVTLNHDHGLVEFDVAPSVGEVLSWSGPSSEWVRFDNDRLPFTIDNKSGGEYVLNGTVDLVGVRPPLASESSS